MRPTIVAITFAVWAARGPSAYAQASSADSSTLRALSGMLLHTGSVVSDVAGGDRRGTVGLGVAAVQLTVQLRPLVGWHGAELFVYLMGTHGGAPSAIVGDVQGVSTLEAPPSLRSEEVWLQQNMRRDRLSLLVGQYDLNTEFYFTRSGNLFLNGSAGMGAEFGLSGVEGPSSFPFTAVGARLAFKPTRNAVARAAVLDGVPVDRPGGGVHLFAPGDGLLLVGEVALLSRPDTAAGRQYRTFLIGRGLPRPYSGKVAIGSWYYTARFPDLVDTLTDGESVQRHGSAGVYLVADQTLWRAPHDGPGLLTAYLQLGLGDPRVNQVGSYRGGGVTLTAPFPTRAEDQLGFAVAAARNGSHFVRAQSAIGLTAPNETALELTYFAQLAPWIAVQPDVQYVINPGGAGATRNAFVLSLQLALSHAF